MARLNSGRAYALTRKRDRRKIEEGIIVDISKQVLQCRPHGAAKTDPRAFYTHGETTFLRYTWVCPMVLHGHGDVDFVRLTVEGLAEDRVQGPIVVQQTATTAEPRIYNAGRGSGRELGQIANRTGHARRR